MIIKKKLLQQRRGKCARFKNFDNRLKALEEKLSVNNNLTKMTQKLIKFLIDDIRFKGPKKIYLTNETDVYHIDDIWSLDILDLKDCSPENNESYRYDLVVIDNFSAFDKFGWTLHLKNKNAQTVKDSFRNISMSSKRKPNLIESD